MNQMEMLKRRSDELNITTEILDQYCLECNKQIDKIDHYRYDKIDHYRYVLPC